MGGIWGVSEMFLGSILHLLKIPFRGVILTAIGFFLMLSLKKMVPRFGSIMLAGIIVICFKFISPNPYLSNIIMAILLEIIFWEVILHLIKNIFLSSIICAIYTGILCTFTSLLGYMVFGGMNISNAYSAYMKQVLLFTDKLGLSFNPLLIYLILNVTLTIVLFMTVSLQSKLLLKRFHG